MDTQATQVWQLSAALKEFFRTDFALTPSVLARRLSTCSEEDSFRSAVRSNNEAAVLSWLRTGRIDVNCTSISFPYVALHDAVAYCSATMVHALLEHGADLNAVSQAGDTPLHAALNRNCDVSSQALFATVQALLRAGASVDSAASKAASASSPSALHQLFRCRLRYHILPEWSSLLHPEWDQMATVLVFWGGWSDLAAVLHTSTSSGRARVRTRSRSPCAQEHRPRLWRTEDDADAGNSSTSTLDEGVGASAGTADTGEENPRLGAEASAFEPRLGSRAIARWDIKEDSARYSEVLVQLATDARRDVGTELSKWLPSVLVGVVILPLLFPETLAVSDVGLRKQL